MRGIMPYLDKEAAFISLIKHTECLHFIGLHFHAAAIKEDSFLSYLASLRVDRKIDEEKMQ